MGRNALAYEPVNIELFYSNQIAITAAHPENPEVVRQFRNSFENLLTNKQTLAELNNTTEGKTLLQQGAQLLRALKLQENLAQCLLEQKDALQINNSISKALGNIALSTPACSSLTESIPKISIFNQKLENHMQGQIRDEMIGLAQTQIKQTESYWNEIEKNDPLELAIDLTSRERSTEQNTPKAGAELLLYTQALQERKNKDFVTQKDIKKALSEVKKELHSNKRYLDEMKKENPESALRRLITTNPVAAAQYLMNHPEALDLICKTMQDIDQRIARNEKIDQALFWGTIVIGGVLVVSGVGAVAGSSMLAYAATGAAIAGTVTSVGETVYQTSKAQSSYIEAQNLRSSSYAEGFTGNAQERVSSSATKANDDLIGASISAAGILPFGYAFKVMKSTARAARLGSFTKILKNSDKVDIETTQSLTKVLKEISSDKDLLRILEKEKTTVSEEEMGQFLGYISELSASEKQKVFKLIKAKPDKVATALRESSKAKACK